MMTHTRALSSILVVGGGIAGWLAATYLQRALGNSVRITLVESPDIPRIGVGEATVSTLRHTMNFLGFQDHEWMPRCNATFKAAIRFEQWNRPASEGPEHFYHPFFPRHEPGYGSLPAWFPEVGDGISLLQFWHARKLLGDTTPFAYAVFPGPHLCDAARAPARLGETDYQIPTAYHLDATALAGFLSEVGVERGIQRELGHVRHVVRREDGSIVGVELGEGRRLEADLFIDCTGFRSVLLGQALAEPFTSDAGFLACNRAVATRPRNADGPLKPYTGARAASAGWIWETPLFHRAGVGYVFSDSFLSPEAAAAELREYLGDRHQDEPIRTLSFEPGRRQRSWVHNCVAIGLSSNFIEPLESTTIFLIEYALANLVALLPDRDFSPARSRRYNSIMQSMYEEIRDFIVLHYVGAKRRDTGFWQDVTQSARIPDSLRERLEFFAENPPLGERFQNFVFRERSYACLLDGLGLLPEKPYPLLAHVGLQDADPVFREIRMRSEQLVRDLPAHRDYLKAMYAAHPAPTSAS